ncbi:hypothetical protein GF352_04325 [archaeon]|nr:hypothetical protein [archaeon]
MKPLVKAERILAEQAGLSESLFFNFSENLEIVEASINNYLKNTDSIDFEKIERIESKITKLCLNGARKNLSKARSGMGSGFILDAEQFLKAYEKYSGMFKQPVNEELLIKLHEGIVDFCYGHKSLQLKTTKHQLIANDLRNRLGLKIKGCEPIISDQTKKLYFAINGDGLKPGLIDEIQITESLLYSSLLHSVKKNFDKEKADKLESVINEAWDCKLKNLEQKVISFYQKGFKGMVKLNQLRSHHQVLSEYFSLITDKFNLLIDALNYKRLYDWIIKAETDLICKDLTSNLYRVKCPSCGSLVTPEEKVISGYKFKICDCGYDLEHEYHDKKSLLKRAGHSLNNFEKGIINVVKDVKLLKDYKKMLVSALFK